MDRVPVDLYLFVFFGLCLRFWIEGSEARLLRLAVALIKRGPSEEDQWRSFGSTVVERTRTQLSAMKVLRLFTILLVVPSTFLVAAHEFREFGRPWAAQHPVLFPLAVGLSLFVLFLLLYALPVRHAQQRVAPLVSNPPRWLVHEGHPPPGIMDLGRAAWDLLIKSFETLSLSPRLRRPRAQLYSEEEELRLAIGESEMASLTHMHEETRPRRADDRRTEADMLRAITRLDGTIVREIMRPINHVVAIRLADYTPPKLLTLARRTGFTRFPCYHDTVTNLAGYINIHDLLGTPEPPAELRPFINRALFVPEVARVDIVLRELLRAKQQVAIVFDEFGGCSGWISREDILEEIVGDIEDEYDRPKQRVEMQHGNYLLSSQVDLDDLAEMIGLHLQKDNCDTLAGYIYNRLGRVPRRGEMLQEEGWLIEVAQVDGHRIRKVRLTPPAADHRPGTD